MADEGTVTVQTGEPEGTAQATTQTGTADGQGQPSATATTTNASGTAAASEEDTFFNPQDLKTPAEHAAYKSMQRSYSKKMEAIKAARAKIDAYDQFGRDPVGTLQAMASRMGFKLTRAEAEAAASAAGAEGTAAWEPKTWDEVMSRAEERIMQRINPLLSDVAAVKKQSLEKMLDESCPDWRQYEDEMTGLLHEHPTLAKDPVKLYRLALPPEVLETRATQAALKKLQGKVDAGKVQGTSTTKPSTAANPDKPLTFNEAVNFAKAKLAEQGIRPPTGG